MTNRRWILPTLLLGVVAVALPLLGHGVVDQAFTGPFDHDFGLNAGGGVSQGFTPTASSVSGVDVFLIGFGTAPSIPLTINIRVGGPTGAIVGTATVLTPANLSGSPSNPYVLHVDFAVPVAVIPGSQYVIQVDPDGGFYGWAASFGDPYAGGIAYQGTFASPARDLGFRTYYAVVISGPSTKDDCKNGGWATYSAPRTFKNQGDCIQYVNTGK